MIPQLASIAIIGTAAWLITSDPLHKFNHAAKPPVVASAAKNLAAEEIVTLSATAEFAKTTAWLNMLPKGAK